MSRELTQRGQWLTMLAKLTSPMESSAAAQAFNAYTPFLTQFPDDAFTIASLEHVAGQCRHGVPTYADVRQHLANWWRDHRPVLPALPAPFEHSPTPPRQHGTTHGLKSVGAILGRGDPTDEERDYVHNIVERGEAEINAAYDAVYDRESIKYPPRPLNRDQLAEAYRKDGIANPRSHDTLAEAYRSAAKLPGPKVPA